MTAYEMMLSESQERMLMVLCPEMEAEAKAIFDKWDLDFAIVGETIAEDRFLILHGNEVKADLPLSPLSGQAPEYDRPYEAPPAPAELEDDVPEISAMAGLRALLGSPNYGDRSWVYDQYDSMVMADTARGPGLGAGIVRVHGTEKLLGIHLGCDAALCSWPTPMKAASRPSPRRSAIFVRSGRQAIGDNR